MATRIGIIHEDRWVKDVTAEELAEQEKQRLLADVYDVAAALSALGKAGIAATSMEAHER